MTCKATQQSDEMFCAHCNIRWDMNDPDPPPCPEKAKQPTDEDFQQLIDGLRLQNMALLASLQVDRLDIRRGASGFATGEQVLVSMERYKLMLDLSITALERSLGR